MNRNENVSGTVKYLFRKFIALKSKYWDEINEDTEEKSHISCHKIKTNYCFQKIDKSRVRRTTECRVEINSHLN